MDPRPGFWRCGAALAACAPLVSDVTVGYLAVTTSRSPPHQAEAPAGSSDALVGTCHLPSYLHHGEVGAWAPDVPVLMMEDVPDGGRPGLSCAVEATTYRAWMHEARRPGKVYGNRGMCSRPQTPTAGHPLQDARCLISKSRPSCPTTACPSA